MAEAKGFTVVESTDVLCTHLTEMVRSHAAELLSRQDVSDMLDRIKEKHESVVQELIPAKLSVGTVHRVLQSLLKERVSIRDLPLILESLSDHAARTQDPMLLTELCRRALGSHISADYLEPGSCLPAIAIHPTLEVILKDSIHRENGDLGILALDPDHSRALIDSTKRLVQSARKANRHPVMVTLPTLRSHLRRLLSGNAVDLPVLSFAEIPETVDIDILGLVSLPEAKK
jgi:flagellar biosynthesis protein FlhA